MAISTVNQNGLNAPLTLTAPNLGTPSAINLTNATALPSAALPTGSVLQVVNGGWTGPEVAGITSATTIFSLSITPKYATSKILVIAQSNIDGTATTNSYVFMQVLRGSTSFGFKTTGGNSNQSSGVVNTYSLSLNALDSPATTSTLTYNLQIGRNSGGTASVGAYGAADDKRTQITLMEIAA
jgi:hypothetical protein